MAAKPASCSRGQTAIGKAALWVSSLAAASECSCALTISRPPTSGWSPPMCDSSRRLARSHTGELPCVWISRGTAGIFWDETHDDRCRSTIGPDLARPLWLWCLEENDAYRADAPALGGLRSYPGRRARHA